MCGRFARPMPRGVLEEHFSVAFPESVKPDWNIAPGLPIPVVARGKKKLVAQPIWGFVPGWADKKKAKPIINARSETVFEKPSFKKAIVKGRCLVPAGAYYEWKRCSSSEKTPFAIRLKNTEIMAFGAILESGYHPSFVEKKITLAILTCNPNELLSSIHDRMPVIIRPENYDLWLNPSTPREQLEELMKPLPSDFFEMYQVCCKVDCVRNHGPELLMKAVIRPTLFD